MGAHLGNNSLSCDIVFKEEVVSLDEELASVFLFRRCPPSPQDNRTVRALLLQHTVYCLYKKKHQNERERRWTGEGNEVKVKEG